MHLIPILTNFMSNEILIAVLSLIGTAFGSLTGIFTANKLLAFRIEKLEKSVEKLSEVYVRTSLLEKEQSVLNHRIYDLEQTSVKRS